MEMPLFILPPHSPAVTRGHLQEVHPLVRHHQQRWNLFRLPESDSRDLREHTGGRAVTPLWFRVFYSVMQLYSRMTSRSQALQETTEVAASGVWRWINKYNEDKWSETSRFQLWFVWIPALCSSSS